MFVTADRNLRYQQNLYKLKLSVVVLAAHSAKLLADCRCITMILSIESTYSVEPPMTEDSTDYHNEQTFIQDAGNLPDDEQLADFQRYCSNGTPRNTITAPV